MPTNHMCKGLKVTNEWQEQGTGLLKEITWDLGRQDTGYIHKYTEVGPMCLPKLPILAHIDGKTDKWSDKLYGHRRGSILDLAICKSRY